MKTTMLCTLLACLPGVALAYPIEVEKQYNGAEISYQANDIDHNMGAITVYNLGGTRAECTARFVNGPETPRVRRSVIAPGESVSLTAKFNRSIIRLRVGLTCKPV
ncbi:S-Ena type endospore appendage [Metapseudomonas otitidis]|uniref:S-Ena type endospore appendage n=1 Tax=Metapseudomonas otitidis TaxID=319939 RepID=UPI0013F62B75|nr:S-Ena type endospore appendage [Pseudomonas otitidis]